MERLFTAIKKLCLLNNIQESNNVLAIFIINLRKKIFPANCKNLF